MVDGRYETKGASIRIVWGTRMHVVCTSLFVREVRRDAMVSA
jgi:hypothetical protein